MTISPKIKEKISLEVIKILIKRFESFPEDTLNNRNAPFHEKFLNAFSDKFDGKVQDIPFFISLSSWLHGLNTTLGQTFFENVAHHLSNGDKREFTSKRLGNLKISRDQQSNISNIITGLSNSKQVPSLEIENKILFNKDNSEEDTAMDFSADVFVEDKDSIIAIELKSVKPNSGEMRGEKHKILVGKTALKRMFPEKDIKFYIGFPFDPTVNTESESCTSHNKERFLGSIINMTKFFAYDECLVADELWDLLSGHENTMEQILDIINAISTPDFLDKFNFLRDSSNRNINEYKNILEYWGLISELELVLNDVHIRNIAEYKNESRLYNKLPFDKSGAYDFDRYYKLREFINE